MQTNKIIISSAMRPVIIYSGSEQIYVKGSRSSIGGQLEEDRVEKNFIDQEFQLKKGDIVYMFSDGYPDQMGGERRKKFMTKPFKKLLLDMQDESMEKQEEILDQTIEDWKAYPDDKGEGYEQMDDITIIGIKF